MQKSEQNKMSLIIQQELKLSGMESEFSIMRVPKIGYGQRLVQQIKKPEEFESELMNENQFSEITISDIEDESDLSKERMLPTAAKV